ncbi:MAG: DUF5680 domain-containing protein [Patescibacteria group bacterium]
MQVAAEDICEFLVEANRHGYGNILVKETDESDGSHTITYQNGDWLFNDNFFGGDPFGGREVISYQAKPVWIMVYFGFATKTSLQKEIYTFLKKALLAFPEDMPYRGPKKLIENEWEYHNKAVGEFANFSGEESISHKGVVIYKAKYQGGLVGS